MRFGPEVTSAYINVMDGEYITHPLLGMFVIAEMEPSITWDDHQEVSLLQALVSSVHLRLNPLVPNNRGGIPLNIHYNGLRFPVTAVLTG